MDKLGILTAGAEGSVSTGPKEMPAYDNRLTVAIIIPTFNHARFLADAIDSVLAQTHQADEIIVVDDGSTDDPAGVVARYSRVQLIRQNNRGLSAARNTGLWSCRTSHVVFLDADDRLSPIALQTGLTCITTRPDCAFVYGAHRLISEDGRPIGPDPTTEIENDARIAFLRGNPIAIHDVLFRRDYLLEMNGFDETLRRCEDFDLLLRIVQKYPIANHGTIVAEYRRHDQNMSSVYAEQLKTVLRLLSRHEANLATDDVTRSALQECRVRKRNLYASQMLSAAVARWRAHGNHVALLKDLFEVARWSPDLMVRALLGFFGRGASKVLPRRIMRSMEQIRGRRYPIPVGSVDFGDFRRTSPISSGFGFDRGTPIDRHYIEKFLAQNSEDIRGCVLEIGDDKYTRRFGGNRVHRVDILSVEPGNPKAAFVGDLACSGVLPEAAFDCIVLTQTLQYVFELRAAIVNLYRALKPGGILLVTAPSVKSQIDGSKWGATWYWWFTAAAMRRLLGECFPVRDVVVSTSGNILAATAFHFGLAFEELELHELEMADPELPLLITARAIKNKDA